MYVKSKNQASNYLNANWLQNKNKNKEENVKLLIEILIYYKI